MEKRKPLKLTHEVDRAKGGGPLDSIKRELADAGLRTIIFGHRFDEERPITIWHRIADFQLVSLKQIAEFTLLQTTIYIARAELPIFVPGELLRESLCFTKLVIMYVSSCNPGASTLAIHLKQIYGITVTEEAPNLAFDGSEAGAVSNSRSEATHFLLYLNTNTFLNEAGIQLAEQIRYARAKQLPIVMAHENDSLWGGCEFDVFFGLTPQDLIDGG